MRRPVRPTHRKRPVRQNIQRLPGRLLVKSANPLYEPFEIDLTADNTDIAIIGRVEWFGRTVN